MCQIKLYLFFTCLFFLEAQTFAKESHTISGYVKDEGTGEELLGVTIYVDEIKNGVVSNHYGFYSITLPKGQYHITLSFIGYETKKEVIDLEQDKSINFTLAESTTELEEVVVEAKEENHHVTNLSIGKSEINIAQVKNLPALFGEPDIIKAVQMQPGVLTAGEGTSAFFVRIPNLTPNSCIAVRTWRFQHCELTRARGTPPTMADFGAPTSSRFKQVTGNDCKM